MDIKFDRTSEDSYSVSLVTKEHFGEVFKGWSRNGGYGWTHGEVNTPTTWKTRIEAAKDLIRRSK